VRNEHKFFFAIFLNILRGNQFGSDALYCGLTPVMTDAADCN